MSRMQDDLALFAERFASEEHALPAGGASAVVVALEARKAKDLALLEREAAWRRALDSEASPAVALLRRTGAVPQPWFGFEVRT